jgi:hypothetical protein
MSGKSADDRLVPITFRASADERSAFEAHAKQENKSVSEWLRERTVEHISFGANYRLLLAEFCAMRQIVLELHAHMLMSGQALVGETVKAIEQSAEKDKFQKADRRILGYMR